MSIKPLMDSVEIAHRLFVLCQNLVLLPGPGHHYYQLRVSSQGKSVLLQVSAQGLGDGDGIN
jgi:hypothetical protein